MLLARRSPATPPSLVPVLALLALPLGGCQAALWANLGALVVTFALFVGTLQLRRTPRSTSAAATPTASSALVSATDRGPAAPKQQA